MKDKVIIITGGSSGIGLAAAKQLAAQGAKIAIAAPASDTFAKSVADVPNAFGVETDMTDETSVRNMIKKVHDHYGRIDVLINNAGRGYEGPLELVNTEKFLYLFSCTSLGRLPPCKQYCLSCKNRAADGS